MGWKGQLKFLSLGWESILDGDCTTTRSTTQGCEKEAVILSHYFPCKDFKFYIKKEEGNWTPEMEHFNSIIFRKSPLANMQHTINESET